MDLISCLERLECLRNDDVKSFGCAKIRYFVHPVTRSKREIPRLKVTGSINAHHVHRRAVAHRIEIPFACSQFDVSTSVTKSD